MPDEMKDGEEPGEGAGPDPKSNRVRDKKALGYGRLGKGLIAAGSSDDPVWWDRGYHPHIESPRLIQHVTFHLADSLPREVVENGHGAEERAAFPT